MKFNHKKKYLNPIEIAKLNNISIIDEIQCIGRYATPIIIGEEVE